MRTLENGNANFIGFGNQAFTSPNFAKDILSVDTIVSGKILITCTKCVELISSMLLFGCVVRDKVYA